MITVNYFIYNMQIKITLFLLTIIIFSCNTLVDYKQEDFEQQIVVNAVMLPNKYLNVSLSKTANVLDNIEFVKKAKVELWANNELLEILTKDSTGYYSTKNYKTTSGIEYLLKISIDGFKQITATDIIPEQQNFDILVFEQSNYSDDYIENYDYLQLIINNDNFSDKYFMLNTPIKKSSSRNYSFLNFSTYHYITSSDYLLRASYYYYLSYIINGEDFNSNQNINLYTKNIHISSLDSATINKLVVLTSLSENYYHFLVSKSIYNNNHYSEFEMNDYTIFSNIENGLGVFVGCNPYVDTLIWENQYYYTQ